MILAKIAELGSLGIFAAASFAEPSLPMNQIGALGLVGFMVVQNYRQGVRLEKVIARKDAEVREAHARANDLAVQFTDAVQNLTNTLVNRPCMVDGENNKKDN